MKQFRRILLAAAALLLVRALPAEAVERVWVCCDRSLYAAGETVWLRGWVMDEEGEAPTSKFLYVELSRDGTGGVERRIKLKERSGLFLGQMELPDDLDSGWYTLRAYTLAQKDWPAEALFHTRLLIRGAGPVPDIFVPMDAAAEADGSAAVKVDLSLAEDGGLSVALTDSEGAPVAGNFSLSLTSIRYADFDYQAVLEAQADGEVFKECDREYTQELDFRVKSVRRRLPEKYSVAIMSQDIGYYFSQEIAGDSSLRGEDGQLFRIPDLDFPEGSLFSVNVTGSPFIYPFSDPEAFAAPFDYGPTWPVGEEIRDTALIRARMEGTAFPVPADDTIATSHITAERKPPFYRPDKRVGPYSSVFEWRQVKLREELSKYDDRDLMMQITAFYPGFFILANAERIGGDMYTTRGGSVAPGKASFHPVDLYIDGVKQEDWSEASILSVRDVQNLYVLRGPEAALYRASAVVMLELRHFDDREGDGVRGAGHQATIGILPLGWQQPKMFEPASSANKDQLGTLYWNPCIRTDAQGHAKIALPELPENYYIRLDGKTLDGRWFSTRHSAR